MLPRPLFALVPLLVGCPPPAPRATPSVLLLTQPADAVLTIAEHQGEGSLEVEIEPGHHPLEITRQGFVPITTTVDLVAGQVLEQGWVLEPLPIAVSVTSHPSGAAVRVDGEAVGTAPWAGEVLAGEHEITVELEGYNTEKTTHFLGEPLAVDAWMDPEGQLLDLLRVFPTGHMPKGALITPDNAEIWVASLGGLGINVHDLATGEELANIRLPDAGSVELLFNEDASIVYASQMETARVFEVDTRRREVLRTFVTGSNFSKVIVYSADGTKLYVSNWYASEISEIDLESGETLRNIPTLRIPRGLYASRDGKTLFVASYEGGGLGALDLESGKTEKLHSGGALRHFVPNSDHTLLYVSDMSRDTVSVLDLKTLELRHLADTDRHPNTIDLSPDGRLLLVSNRGPNGPGGYLTVGSTRGSLLVVDTATGEILDAVAAGMQSTALDVSDDGQFVVLSDFRDDQLRLFRIPSHEVLRAGGGGRLAHHADDLVDLTYERATTATPDPAP